MADPRIIQFEGRRISVPGDATDEEIAQIISAPPPKPLTTSRGVGLAAQGFNDAVADTIGAPVDLAAFGVRQLGIPANDPVGGSASIKNVLDYVATAPGRIGDAVSQGSLTPFTETRTARGVPQDTTEKVIYGAGKGVGGAASMFVPAGMIARTMTPGTAGQGVMQTMAAQPGMQTLAGAVGGGTSEATGSPYAGMAAALAVPGALAAGRRALTPAGDAYLNDEQRRLAAVLAQSGVPLTAGQATGAPWLRTVESGMKFHPLTSAVAGADARTQRAAFNRAVTGETGVVANEASPSFLAETKDRLGSAFDAISSRNAIKQDDQFFRDVGSVANKYDGTLDALKKPIFDKLVSQMTGADKPLLDRLIGAISGTQQLDGPAYQQLRSQLGTMAKSAMATDPYYGQGLKGLQTALDSAMGRSVSAADAAEWQQLRGQYGAYKTIDQAMRSGSGTAGDVPPAQLHIAARDRGNQTLKDLGMAGKEFVRDTVPNSGTPQRLMTSNLMTAGAAGGATIDPLSAVLAFLAPPVIQAGMRSVVGKAYLGNNLMGGVESPMTKRLLADVLAQRQLQDSQNAQR